MGLQCNNHHSGHNTYKKTVLVLALLSLAGLLMKVPKVPKVPQVLMKVEKILEQVYYYLDIKCQLTFLVPSIELYTNNMFVVLFHLVNIYKGCYRSHDLLQFELA